jgi:hypothetical protein
MKTTVTQITVVSLVEGGILQVSQGRDSIYLDPAELPLLVAACERLTRPTITSAYRDNWHAKHRATATPGTIEWFEEVGQ